MFILVKLIDAKPYRYCNDGKWRDFAPFGTVPGAVKEYVTDREARKVANKKRALVVAIPNGIEIDMAGNITEKVPCPDKPGYENVIQHRLDNFVVHDGSRRGSATV